MISLPHARLALCCASVFAVGTLALELPVSELMHQRSELTSLRQQLATVSGRNAQVAAEIASLRQSSVIAAIAHADYGLVRPGQRAYVVLPSSSPTPGAANTLAQAPIPPADLVPVDPGLSSARATAAPTAPSEGSVLHRMFARLAFWRWAF